MGKTDDLNLAMRTPRTLLADIIVLHSFTHENESLCTDMILAVRGTSRELYVNG